MNRITSLEVDNSNFNISDEKNESKLYTDLFGGFSLAKLKDEFEEILGFSDIQIFHPSIYRIKQ